MLKVHHTRLKGWFICIFWEGCLPLFGPNNKIIFVFYEDFPKRSKNWTFVPTKKECNVDNRVTLHTGNGAVHKDNGAVHMDDRALHEDNDAIQYNVLFFFDKKSKKVIL